MGKSEAQAAKSGRLPPYVIMFLKVKYVQHYSGKILKP